MMRADIDRAARLFVEKGEYVVLRGSRAGMSEFFELMEAIEALCPVWPEREPVSEEGWVHKL